MDPFLIIFSYNRLVQVALCLTWAIGKHVAKWLTKASFNHAFGV